MNSRVIVRTALMLALALSIAACKSGNPINEPEIRLATIPTGGKLSEAQIADAIKRGGQARGWVMTDAEPGHITGLLRVRDKHTAVTDISYSKTQIKIAYKDSENLDYDDGHIHRNYNKWVELLAESIREQLKSAS